MWETVENSGRCFWRGKNSLERGSGTVWDRLGPFRPSLARLASARLGLAWSGSVQLGSARLGSAWLGSARAQPGSNRLGLAQLDAVSGFFELFFPQSPVGIPEGKKVIIHWKNKEKVLFWEISPVGIPEGKKVQKGPSWAVGWAVGAVGAVSAWPRPARLGSARFGPARSGSASPARLGRARLGLAWPSSDHFGSAWLDPVCGFLNFFSPKVRNF